MRWPRADGAGDAMKRTHPSRPCREAQSGVALFVLIALTGVVAVVAVMNLLKMTGTAELEREQATREALAKAKRALIAYAVSRMDASLADIPALLPCPSLAAPTLANNEGIGSLNCGTKYVSALGRLPWKQLGVEPIRDGHGECLWYLVTGTYKGGSQPPDILNWDSLGNVIVVQKWWDRTAETEREIKLAGANIPSQAVAAIIAPGPAIEGIISQGRAADANTAACPGNFDPTNYLEAGGGYDNTLTSPIANGNTTLINGYADPQTGSTIVNDRVLFVSREDIYSALMARSDFIGSEVAPGRIRQLMIQVTDCIANYANQGGPSDKRLLFAAALTVTDYRNTAAYGESTLLRGRVPSSSSTSKVLLGRPYEFPTACPHWSAGSFLESWFNAWKDHLYIAIAPAFDPNRPATATCGTECLTVGSRTNVAAVVFFAGHRLTNPQQTVTVEPHRNNISNYLEPHNASRFVTPSLGNDFVTPSPANEAPQLNDIAYCLLEPPAGQPYGAPVPC